MSDAIPAQPQSALSPRSILALSFLILMFVSGLLLVYLVDAGHPPAAVGQGERDSERAAPSAVMATPESSEAMSGPWSNQQLAAETQAVRELLRVTQQKVQILEEELKALKNQQARAAEIESRPLADDPANIARRQAPTEAEDSVQ